MIQLTLSASQHFPLPVVIRSARLNLLAISLASFLVVCFAISTAPFALALNPAFPLGFRRKTLLRLTGPPYGVLGQSRTGLFSLPPKYELECLLPLRPGLDSLTMKCPDLITCAGPYASPALSVVNLLGDRCGGLDIQSLCLKTPVIHTSLQTGAPKSVIGQVRPPLAHPG
jgi:hypothetical protein